MNKLIFLKSFIDGMTDQLNKQHSVGIYIYIYIYYTQNRQNSECK